MARLQGEYQPLVVSAQSDIKTLGDLVKKYKADPGSVSWGGFGLGSPDHLVSALVVKAVGGDVTKMNYIVVGAGGEMLPFIISNKITVATGGYAEFADHIKSGKLRAIGISSPERLPGIDVPTFKEQGVDAELVNWRGLVGSPAMAGADLAAADDGDDQGRGQRAVEEGLRGPRLAEPPPPRRRVQDLHRGREGPRGRAAEGAGAGHLTAD